MSVHVNDLGEVNYFARPYRNGKPVDGCVDLDEFEGWIDVYEKPYRIVGDSLVATRKYGDVQLHIVPPKR